MLKMYFYGMCSRGCAPGCQPENGFVRRMDANTDRFWDIIVYDRPLSKEEENHFSLIRLMAENGKPVEDESIQEMVEKFLREATDDVFLKLQKLLDIDDGTIEPLMADRLDRMSATFAKEIVKVINYQRFPEE